MNSASLAVKFLEDFARILVWLKSILSICLPKIFFTKIYGFMVENLSEELVKIKLKSRVFLVWVKGTVKSSICRFCCPSPIDTNMFDPTPCIILVKLLEEL